MNILFISPRIIYGGGEKVLNWLAVNLIKEAHTVFTQRLAMMRNIVKILKRLG